MSSRSSPDEPLPAPGSLAIHLDLVGGIAGDMFVAAMVDALPALAAPVLAAVEALRPAGRPAAGFRATASNGLRALAFGSADATQVEHAQSHAHGTAYPTIRGEIATARLSEPVRDHALALLDVLADAEARVHGIDRAAVHFHELADWDSRLDLVAAGAVAAALAGARWSASAPPRGGGTVRTAHGVLPVPAPATAWLLAGYPWRDDGVGGERVTPTGAAILRHLVPAGACDTGIDAGRLHAQGFGAGTRALPGMPNVLRALVFERSAATAADRIAVIEFDVDDMTGEEIALAAERLREVAGALDVSVGTRAGKKGRPLADFRVLADCTAADAVAAACFAETATLGLRVREDRRRVLQRREVETAAAGATVRVKIARRPDGTATAKTAHDDVAGTPGLAARRRLRTAGETRALDEDAG